MKPEVNKELIGTCNANSHGLALVRSFLFLKAVIKAIFAGTDFFFFFFLVESFVINPTLQQCIISGDPECQTDLVFLPKEKMIVIGGEETVQRSWGWAWDRICGRDR